MLLDRLPVNSAYREAMLDDPEVAEALANQPEANGPPQPPGLQEFTPVVAVLADMRDLLQLVHSDLLASGGVKPPPFTPAPRPVTGVQRARARVERARHDELVDEVKAAQERWRARREAEEG